MNIRIKTTNVALTDSLREYVNRSLDKITRIVGGDPAIQCDIELARTTEHHQKGPIFHVDLHIVGSGHDQYAAAENEDLNLSITEVRDEIMRKLKSGKGKRISYIRRSGARVKAMVRGIWPWGESGWYGRRK